jgi:GT2 family glycosyltransferase
MSKPRLEDMQCEIKHATELGIEKDILMVVHNQVEYIRQCIKSIQDNTEKFNLFIWDNGSNEETLAYLRSLPDDVTLVRSAYNQGFIGPNNRLIELGKAPYIILINSDAVVFEGWDRLLVGWLEYDSNVAQTGFQGGILDHNGKGVGAAVGYDIDYVCGWCSCISRKTYDEFGLFDEEHLEFAYCEDSDFSMRLREAGKKIYALHTQLAHHFQNKTVVEVMKEQEIRHFIAMNHQYLKKRWEKFLPTMENQ